MEHRLKTVAKKQHQYIERRPNLESEREDLKNRLDQEHGRERHVEVGQSVAVQDVCLVFMSRVKLQFNITKHQAT